MSENISVRNLKWDFSEATDQHRNSSPFDRLLFNAMSLVFPEGERFFVRSVKNFAGRATQQPLKDDIKAFIGQEIQHGKAHELFNEQILEGKYDTSVFLRIYKTVAFDLLEPIAKKMGGAELALSVTAAAEHYTATWAEAVLSSGRVNEIKIPSLQRLARWHALEELEHKHVAFDLLKLVDNSYARRIAGMLIATGLLSGFVSLAFVLLLVQEKNIEWDKLLSGALHDFADKHGFTNLFLKAIPDYFRPDFHPNQKNDLELLEKTRAALAA